jgi:hypothetical protein
MEGQEHISRRKERKKGKKLKKRRKRIRLGHTPNL